ncbi:hypothetical protein LZ31DRAFT_299876 [Colletotrichum somersetense]|nr:hypothetical protein LZ31DRAFT_299876 [Colletotrichum somersetense]
MFSLLTVENTSNLNSVIRTAVTYRRRSNHTLLQNFSKSSRSSHDNYSKNVSSESWIVLFSGKATRPPSQTRHKYKSDYLVMSRVPFIHIFSFETHSVLSMSATDSMGSEATLTDPFAVLKSPDKPTHRTTSKTDASISQTFRFLKVVAAILFLWMKLLLLPLVGWNVASTAMFIFMRSLPCNRRLEGFLRLSYNIAAMEMGGYKMFPEFDKMDK